MFRDPDSGDAEVTFEQDPDPPLADGNPGSGTESAELRSRRPGGDWSAWTADPDEQLLHGTVEGEQWEIEARSADTVGNVSTVAAVTLTIPVDEPWTPEEIEALRRDVPTEELLSRPYDPDDYDKPLSGDDMSWAVGDEEPPTFAASKTFAPMALAASAAAESGGGSEAEDALSGVLGYATSCQGGGASAAATPSQSCPAPKKPYEMTKRKQEELRCPGELRIRLGRRRTLSYCPDEPQWTWVYRLVKTVDRHRDGRPIKEAYYVGITKDPVRRCAEHGFQLPNRNAGDCQMLAVMPNLGAALSAEQFLMEAYGFDPDDTTRRDGRPIQNINYDTGNVREEGWFNGRDPVLINGRRNFSAKRFRPLYCIASVWGEFSLELYPPSLSGHYPPGTAHWWANFPSRDCRNIARYENSFRRVEHRAPAHPRS